MPTKLQQKQDELAAKRAELGAIFEAAGPDLALTDEQVSEVKQRNDHLSALGAEVDGLREMERISEANKKELADLERPRHTVGFAGGASDNGAATKANQKTLGELFVGSNAYKGYMANGQASTSQVEYSVKTLLSEGAGFTPQAIRTGQVIESAQQMPRIVDVIPSTTTTQTAVVFMRETLFTNAAAETAEAGLYPEAALQFSEVNMPVRKVAVFLPVTDEQLADVQGMQERINNRLTLMLRQRLDAQIVNGDGTGVNLTGLLNTAGILTQARGTDPGVDAVFKAIVKLRAVGFVEPNAILMNPLDWQNIRLLRSADGVYIFGFPGGDSATDRLWGLPVISSTYVALGTAITADFAGYTEIAYKAGIEFEVSNSHLDYFANGKLAIRAQLRAAMIVLRPSAVATATGL